MSASWCRYLFQDTWNILDTLTIGTIAMAFVARILGLGGNWSADEGGMTNDDDLDASTEFSRGAFFASQFFLAAVAPMLFARLLFLSQIDSTLGPMTQVTPQTPLWRAPCPFSCPFSCRFPSPQVVGRGAWRVCEVANVGVMPTREPVLLSFGETARRMRVPSIVALNHATCWSLVVVGAG